MSPIKLFLLSIWNFAAASWGNQPQDHRGEGQSHLRLNASVARLSLVVWNKAPVLGVASVLLKLAQNALNTSSGALNSSFREYLIFQLIGALSESEPSLLGHDRPRYYFPHSILRVLWEPCKGQSEWIHVCLIYLFTKVTSMDQNS